MNNLRNAERNVAMTCNYTTATSIDPLRVIPAKLHTAPGNQTPRRATKPHGLPNQLRQPRPDPPLRCL